MEQLQAIYTEYAAASAEAKKKSSIIAEFFGSADSVKRAPCHQAFYDQLVAWMENFVAASPSSEDACHVADFLMTQPLQHQEQECYWYMYASIGLIDKLLPSLSPAHCGQLYEKMGKLYRRRDRLPTQETLYKALGKKAKE